jgi:hypothetical protein
VLRTTRKFEDGVLLVLPILLVVYQMLHPVRKFFEVVIGVYPTTYHRRACRI